jgi:hypothetical protein
MARAGWINQYDAPSACQIGDFVAGAGMTVSGFAPPLGPSLGETWGHVRGTNANDFATEVGVGGGLGRALGISGGYNWRLTPVNLKGWR